MATEQPSAGPPGPFIQVAAVVERVLHERDDVLSLIRLVDRLQIQVAGVEGGPVPDELPEGQIDLTLVLCFKSGDARGRHKISIQPELPSGQSMGERTVDVHFDGDERGANLILNVVLPAIEGLYWIPVRVNGRELTRVPYRVLYRPTK